MTDDQQVTLVTALLGGDLAIAAILFGVLGFLYTVYATFAPPKLRPNEKIPPPHPILIPLARVARCIVLGLGISAIIAIGCLSWFLCPEWALLVAVVAGLLFEVTFLFAVSCYVTFRLMP